MSHNYLLPAHDIYNKSRSLSRRVDKENNPNITNKVMSGRSGIPTPDDDGFDDDDDDLMIAASQQIDKKLAQEKVDAASKVGNTFLQIQGENLMLRGQISKVSREKEQMHFKKIEEQKLLEQKFKKEIENLKSKLEFKDRDVEELKLKFQTTDNSRDSCQPAKRPRLSVVKPESRSRASAAAVSSKNKHCFRITAPKLFGCLELPSPSPMDEDSTEIDYNNLVSFYQRLDTSSVLQKKFNIRSCSEKSVCSKEISSTISQLFLQAETFPSWQDKKIRLQILSVLLAHNSYPALESEVPKLLKVLQSCTSEQHSVITDFLLCSGSNVLVYCSRSSSFTCLLNGLVRFPNCLVLDLLHSSVLQQKGTIHPCFCGNEMLMYICVMLKDNLSGDLLSSSIEIENKTTFHKCMRLLCSLLPFFLGMKVNCYVQTMFFGCLDLLKKCSSMALSGVSMTEQLYEAAFESANNSMTS